MDFNIPSRALIQAPRKQELKYTGKILLLNLKHPIKAIIFDHDGTLVDSEPTHLQMWRDVLAPHELNADDYSNYLSGKPTAQSAAWVKEKFKLSQSPEDLEKEKKRILKNHLQTSAFPIMQGAIALLDFLRQQNVPLAVASGATTHEVEHSLQYHDLNQYFSFVSTGDMVTNNKPAPDVYLYAAQNLQVDPKHCLAIEDSDAGQTSAEEAGMVCLRLDTPSQLGQSSNKTRLIKSLLDAHALIKPLFSAS